MKAPREVWCTISKDGQLNHCASYEIRSDLFPARYLLASLKCGDCKHIAASLALAPEYLWVCMGEQVRYMKDRNAPACMAIVPKEEAR
jgi:hypothetical protein